MAARRLRRTVSGVPAAPFYGRTIAVMGNSKTNCPERLAWADVHEITRGGGFQKCSSDRNRHCQAGEGERGVFRVERARAD